MYVTYFLTLYKLTSLIIKIIPHLDLRLENIVKLPEKMQTSFLTGFQTTFLKQTLTNVTCLEL